MRGSARAVEALVFLLGLSARVYPLSEKWIVLTEGAKAGGSLWWGWAYASVVVVAAAAAASCC